MSTELLSAAAGGDRGAFDRLVADHERALLLFAYHLTGSIQDADDVLQEVLMRAWAALATFTGAGSFRGWLRRIAANVVIDRGRAARRRPELIGLPWDPAGELPAREPGWVEPFPDARLPDGPEQHLATVQTLELAFVGLLQRLPPRQRAVYVLRELVGASAAETAQSLEMSEDAVTSALARARSTLGTPGRPPVGTEQERALAERYARAWSTRDLDTLVGLLTEDVKVAMPPYEAWISGREAVRTFLVRHLGLGSGPAWSARVVGANRRPALALVRPDRRPFGVMLLTVDGDRVGRVDAFVMPELLNWFP